MSDHSIRTLEQLKKIFGESSERSRIKETDHLTEAYARWLEQATFFTIASHSHINDQPFDNIDCSPRGDETGSLLRISNSKTLLIPDRKGNNRIDTLRNLVAKPDIALLFFTPGITEALRVKGTATVSTDPALLQLFDINGKPAIVVIKVDIRSVYFQCSRAAVRAGLWDVDTFRQRGEIPSPGEMLHAAGAKLDPASYDVDLAERMKDL